MKKHTDKIDDKKKASEAAIERWENEGGEALPIARLNKKRAAIEKRQNKSGERQHTGKVSDNSFEREIFQKKSDQDAPREIAPCAKAVGLP